MSLRKVLALALAFALCLEGQGVRQPARTAGGESRREARQAYILGPDDQITVQVIEGEEISGKTYTITPGGDVSLPMVGRIRAAGMSVEEFEERLRERLKAFLHEPQVAVTITEYRSQPVSVLGAVNAPGEQQLRGRKTLLDAIRSAGGVRPEGGTTVRIVRRSEYGRLPLKNAVEEPGGGASVAEVDLAALMETPWSPENIALAPHDSLTVPQAPVIYVIGEVARQGSIVLAGSKSLSLLEAISSVGGLTRTAAPKNVKVLRLRPAASKRDETTYNFTRILMGQHPDVALMANDIVFVPDSKSKRTLSRALEAAIATGTGILTLGIAYRR